MSVRWRLRKTENVVSEKYDFRIYSTHEQNIRYESHIKRKILTWVTPLNIFHIQ